MVIRVRVYCGCFFGGYAVPGAGPSESRQFCYAGGRFSFFFVDIWVVMPLIAYPKAGGKTRFD